MHTNHSREDNAHFISLSDMMTALMMIFLFISIAIVQQIKNQSEQVKEITQTYENEQESLLMDLREEFKDDLIQWQAEINDDMSFVFTSPEVLFDSGQETLKPKFQEILSDFFPRYISVIRKYQNSIQEIRIEGYTDTDCLAGMNQTLEECYFYNMRLSQGRTRTTLQYCLGLDFPEKNFDELKELMTANGLSFSHLKKKNGVEDKELSRRVEFRVLTKAEAKIKEIVNQLKK